MEAISLKITVIVMVIVMAALVISLMGIALYFNKRNDKNRNLINTMEDHAESQSRLISLLRNRRDAGDLT
jgi:uncharacterized membrane protein